MVARANVRCMSVNWNDKERAAEKAWFNQEDEKLLRKLVSKMRSSGDKAAVAAAKSLELQKLEEIVKKYNISDADKQALIAWRHNHEF